MAELAITAQPGGQRRRPMRKRAELVARQIENDIIERGWPVGEVLGSEASLRETYDVSRAVLREAVRLLEHYQFAVMQRGPGGGLVVRAPTASIVAEGAAAYLDFADVSIDEIFEARECLELLVVQLAAERMTEQGILQLRSVVQSESEPELENGSRPTAHQVLAELSGNPALAIFIDALRRAARGTIRPAARARLARDQSLEEANRRAHSAIVEAVIAGDVGLAQHQVQAHLADMAKQLLRLADDRRGRPRAAATGRVDAVRPGEKLPGRIAREIQQDIKLRGWPVGDLIGSETDLQQRYHVSRAVLREAIRLLEHHGVAEMRRGPGGGLIVGEPDPERAARAVAVYLEWMKFPRAELHAVRCATELTCIQIATQRVTASARLVLEAALEQERSATPDELNAVMHELHLAIAEVAGNRALHFIISVLINLIGEHTIDPARISMREKEEVAAQGRLTHHRIADAIMTGDAGVARHRMLRHLDALEPWVVPERLPAAAARPSLKRRGRSAPPASEPQVTKRPGRSRGKGR